MLNTNIVKVAGAEATGEKNVMISCWLSLILLYCLCHHGREIGGFELLVQTYASKGGLAGHIIGAKDDGRLHHLPDHVNLPATSWAGNVLLF